MTLLSSGHVLHAYGIFSLPEVALRGADHLPAVAVVAGTVLAVGGDFLIVRERRWIVVAVKVLSRSDVKQAYDTIAFYGCTAAVNRRQCTPHRYLVDSPAFTIGADIAADLPVAVHVVGVRRARHRLKDERRMREMKGDGLPADRCQIRI